MTLSTFDTNKRKRGRPREGRTEQILVRISPAEMEELDHWIAQFPGPRPTRAEAMRRLAMIGMHETGNGVAVREIIGGLLTYPWAEADLERRRLAEKCEEMLAELRRSYEV